MTTGIDPAKFPELSRIESVQTQSQTIGEFIEWLTDNGMAICTAEKNSQTSYWPVMDSAEALLARHFNVDLKTAERERQAILADFAPRAQRLRSDCLRMA